MEPVVAGHPLHPTLITIPMGLFPASYVLDILALLTDNDKLAEAAYYNMLMGYLGAVPAAITGFLDYSKMEQKDPAHTTASTHGILNAGIMALYGLNLVVRHNNKRSLFGLALSTAGTTALVLSGYLGGEIAYGRGWRVRSTERFELEWQKQHKVGPFAEKGHGATTTQEEFPPQVIKAFEEKKSGKAVYKEIAARPDSNIAGETKPKISQYNPGTTPVNKSGPVHNSADGKVNTDKPSQAEGDREAIEAELNQTRPEPAIQAPASHPSQAEGDREAIDKNLNQKSSQPPTAQG